MNSSTITNIFSERPLVVRSVAKLKPASEGHGKSRAFEIQSVQLPDENVKADVSVSARIRARNLSSFHPLEIEMQLSGRTPSVERFSIPLGKTRDIVVAGPRLYRTGRHDISIVFSRNGNAFHKVSRTINVAETPAAFFVDSSTISKSVFPDERLAIRAAGVDDESAGTLGYEVYLDGKLVFESGHMVRGDEAKTVDVKIANATQLKLIVTTGADKRNDGDHADWADACFIRP